MLFLAHWLFVAVHGHFLVAASGGYSLLPWALAASCGGFSSCGMGLSCPEAGGTFLDQGSNLCPVHWQVDS